MNILKTKRIMKKMEQIFIENGFQYVTLENGEQYMCKNEYYCRLEYVKGMNCIIIEAGNKREALLNILGDGDSYKCSLSENEILSFLREDIKYYVNVNKKCEYDIICAVDFYANRGKDQITIEDIQNYTSEYTLEDLIESACCLIQQKYVQGEYKEGFKEIKIYYVTESGKEYF